MTGYTMVVLGGDGTELHLPAGTGGIAPIDAQACSTIAGAVVFVFTERFGNNPGGVCEIAAQEVSHTFSLDHEYLATDPMSYLSSARHKTFQDQLVQCGEYRMRP